MAITAIIPALVSLVLFFSLWLSQRQLLYRIHTAIQSFQAGKPEKMLRLTQQSVSSHNGTVWTMLRREIALQPAGAIPLEQIEVDILNALDVLQKEQNKTVLLTAISNVLVYCAWSLNFVPPGSIAEANIRHQMATAYRTCTNLSSKHNIYAEAAFDCYHYALRIYQAQHYDKEYVVTLYQIGDLYLSTLQSCIDQVSRLQLALHYHECAAHACHTDIPPDTRAQTYYNLSKAYYTAYEVTYDHRYLNKAYTTYKKTLSIYEQLSVQAEDHVRIAQIKDTIQSIESTHSPILSTESPPER